MYQVFIQWLEGCQCGTMAQVRHGMVRLYRLPLSPLLEDLPSQPWIWNCMVTLKGREAFMFGAIDAPPQGGMGILVRKAREVGADQLVWDRVEKNGIRRVRFNL